MALKKRSQTSGLFLLELILAILFFAIVSSVCVRFFVKSHIYSRDAMRLNHSVQEVTSVLEIAASAETPETAADRIREAYPDAGYYKTSGLQVVVFYDADFKPCKDGEDAYVLYADIAIADNSMLTVTCTMYTQDLSETIYTLQSVHHVQEVNAHAK